MQHTDKYNFRIIEDTDTFSPDALNGNTRDFEKQLTALEDADAALAQSTANADAALQATAAADKTELLTAIGSGGKTCRIAYGSYKGKGTSGVNNANSLTFDFRPLLVCTAHESTTAYHFMMRNILRSTGDGVDAVTLQWEDQKVIWYASGTGAAATPATQHNLSGVTYHYFAIGESLD